MYIKILSKYIIFKEVLWNTPSYHKLILLKKELMCNQIDILKM